MRSRARHCLSDIPLLADCTHAEREVIARCADDVWVLEGDQIHPATSAFAWAYLVVAGTVVAEAADGARWVAGPGVLFGADDGAGEHPLELRAASAARILVFGRREVLGLLEDLPAFRSIAHRVPAATAAGRPVAEPVTEPAPRRSRLRVVAEVPVGH